MSVTAVMTEQIRIAVVDDDAAICKALKRVLNTASYHVDSFAGAREFIAALAHGVPACALIDLQMPEMTGLELQRYLSDAGISLPMIVITSHDDPDSRERCFAEGASDYLLKPLRRTVLLEAIEKALGSKEA